MHAALGRLPPGTYDYLQGKNESVGHPPPYNTAPQEDRRCWMHDLLPYLEQGPLYAEFDAWMSKNNSALYFIPQNATVIPTLMCPSDPSGPKVYTYGNSQQGFSGNVIGCAGNDYFKTTDATQSVNLNGLLFAASKVTFSDVHDGLSNTAMLSELILVPDTASHDVRGRYYNPIHGGALFSTRLPPNNSIADQFAWCSVVPFPEGPCIDMSTNIFISARSYHRGGVNLGMADGAVRFVSQTVDQGVFQALGSRSGNEVPVPF